MCTATLQKLVELQKTTAVSHATWSCATCAFMFNRS